MKIYRRILFQNKLLFNNAAIQNYILQLKKMFGVYFNTIYMAGFSSTVSGR